MSFDKQEEVKLGNICEVCSSKRIFASDYTQDGIPFYRSKEVIEKANDLQISEKIYISIEKFDEIENKFGSPKRGDILLASIGANMGVPYFVDTDMKFYFKDGNVTWFKNFKEMADSKFVYYWLKSSEAQSILINIAIGSAQKALTIDSLRKITIRLRCINQQLKIIYILSCLDNKIHLNNCMNKILEQMTQAMFKQWFVDFEFPNENGEPYKSSGGDMEWSEKLGKGIPLGWKASSLSEISVIENKTINPQKSTDIIFEHYSIPAFDSNQMPVFEKGESIKSNKFIVVKDNILVSKLNPEQKRVWRPVCITNKSVCSTEFIVYKAVNTQYTEFLYSVLNDMSFNSYLMSRVTGSTGSRQRAEPKATLNYTFAMPPFSIAKRYCETVEPINKKIQNNLLQTDRLTMLRDTLLPKLMSGEIDVSEVRI